MFITRRTSHDFNVVVSTRVLFDLLHNVLYISKSVSQAKPQFDLAVDLQVDFFVVAVSQCLVHNLFRFEIVVEELFGCVDENVLEVTS